MPKFTRLLFVAPLFFYLVSCSGNSEGKKTLYYYTIAKEKARDHRDSLYANSDLDAVDSTIKRFYLAMDEYETEKSKVQNNPYLDKPVEWHVMNQKGSYVTSVSDEEIQKLEAKYK